MHHTRIISGLYRNLVKKYPDIGRLNLRAEDRGGSALVEIVKYGYTFLGRKKFTLNSEIYCKVMLENEVPVGIAIRFLSEDTWSAMVYVATSHRKKGYAMRLMKSTAKNCDKLTVFPWSDESWSFYNKLSSASKITQFILHNCGEHS